MQTLEFHLDKFDGPMDLLMHLIEKNRIDIYNIPISELTDQYFAYLDDARSMNLEIASHFLLFASQLIRIKIRTLLPKRRNETVEEDPRQALVDQIIAYKFFKELSTDLEELHSVNLKYYPRKVDKKSLCEKYKKIDLPVGLDPNILSKAFDILEKSYKDKNDVMIIEKSSYSIEALKEDLLDYCRSSSCPTFQNVLKECVTVDEMVTFFLALLECIRQNELIAIQNELFGEIWLSEVDV